MIKIKIDEAVMTQMLRDGKTVSAIARHFNCTHGAVSQMKKRMDRRLINVPDVQQSELSRHNIDTVQQLRAMNVNIIEELKRTKKLITREDAKIKDIEDLEDQIKKNPGNTNLVKALKERGGIDINSILKIQANIIAISAEVRKQIELQVKIFETVYNVQMVSEFQEEIIEILRSVDPVLKDTVIKRLKQRRSIRGLVKM